MSVLRLDLMVLLAFCFGCANSNESEPTQRVQPSETSPINDDVCSPDVAQWANVERVIKARCAGCHGETPTSGAPYSLLQPTELLSGPPGNRRIDNVLDAVRLGTMPPTGQEPLTVEESQTIIDWATCGQGLPDTVPMGPRPGGFDVTRSLYPSPTALPTNAETIEFTADRGSISPDESDRYVCYSFEWPEGEDRLIRRFEALIDDARILHHMVLYAVDEGPGGGMETDCGAGLHAAVYAWAPGLQAFQFVEGGLLAKGGQKYTLELHYNNSARYDDVSDESGVRIFHAPTGNGPKIDMLTIGPEGFTLPGNQRTAVEGDCVIDRETTVVATLPHMHEIGYQLQSTVIRKDGTEEDLVTITGWDFDYQLAYDTNALVLQPGDRIRTKCVFNNPYDDGRRFGPYTDDEMCYNFLYVSPPPQVRRCNGAPPTMLEYEPGECAPMNAQESVTQVSGPFIEGAAPALTVTEAPQAGRWLLTRSTTYMSTRELGPVELDLDETFNYSFGIIQIDDDGTFALDLRGMTIAVSATGDFFEQPFENTVAGELLGTGDGTLSVKPDCPMDGAPRDFRFQLVDGELTMQFDFNVFVPGTAEVTFRRQE